MADAKKTRPFNDSIYGAVCIMAESYLWRGEMDRGDFWQVVVVLKALGYLDEYDCDHIQEDLDEMFPVRDNSAPSQESLPI